MTEAELKRRLEQILNEETRTPPDWDSAEKLCCDLNKEIASPASDSCPHHIHHFLADYDIRRRDPHYAENQHDEVREYLATQVLN